MRLLLMFALLARATSFSSSPSTSRRQGRSRKIAALATTRSSIQQDVELYQHELFSVAPMMGHTNRHFRYFFRLLSKRTHLYTEMIPSAQILRAYRLARKIYLGTDCGAGVGNPEEILEVIYRISENPGKEHQYRNQGVATTLSELVGISGTAEHPVVLQLGGRDPKTLGAASLVGKAFGNYDSINLNCGCPSMEVGVRSGGAALMKDPSLVARCVEAMNDSISAYTGARKSIVTVKHRLGVKDASTYDAFADRKKDDRESYETCRTFVEAVALGGSVVKFHVHARLGLLGEFLPDESELQSTLQGCQQLWVPKQKGSTTNGKAEKINHKREQGRAQLRARQATIKNRDVPPLRPGVVQRLADEFPRLEFVRNGGTQNLPRVKQIVDEGRCSNVVGAMVGRAVINHPCAFASADALWETRSVEEKATLCRPTRAEVLHDFIAYCDREEERMISLGASPESIDILRRRLVAVPFHLFVGEDGSDEFQRKVKKLMSRTMLIKASSMLLGASTFVPAHTLDKCVDDHVPWENIVVYEGGLRRSSAMQRIVY